ncbi:MAG: diguanylate cyclase [Nitrospirae bacterium]|nr:diguanylate cyclase [Nitrospirota bacterium]
MRPESRHLLLVEDSPDQSELILRAFRRKNPEFKITAVENGPACLDALRDATFEAVLLDFSLPRMTGLEVLSQIREQGMKLPVIMITGQGDEAVAVKAMKAGASDYIIKTKNYFETLPMVVENAVKKHRLVTDLEEASSRARRLYEVSLSITKERKIDVLARTLIRGANQLIKTQGAVLLIVPPDQPETTVIFSDGVDIQAGTFNGSIASAGLFGSAYLEKRPVVIEAVQEHSRWGATPAHQPFLRQILAVPLLQPGEIVGGVLVVGNKLNGEPFSPEDVDTLSTLTMHAATAIDNARFMAEMETRATTDGLTGCLNHREMQGRLDQEVERSTRYGKDFSFLMIDVDHFKLVNDSHGHPIGDVMLKSLVAVIQKSVRTVDLLARYGGEEFAVILPETSQAGAERVAERIRKAIDESPFTTPSGHPLHLSVSIGIASFPTDANSRLALISAADQALFSAKNEGRNRIGCYSKTPVSVLENDQARLMTLLEDPTLKGLADLAAGIDARTPYFRGHTQKVLQLGFKMADALNLSEPDKQNLQLASLLHNIGTASIPESILNKWGPLTLEERRTIQAHPLLVEMLIKGSDRFESVLPAVLYHHERYDGKGYPKGLRGEEIPFLARVISVIDAYQALVSVRPYRPRLTREQAILELKKNSGTQFDPQLVEALVGLLEESSEET